MDSTLITGLIVVGLTALSIFFLSFLHRRSKQKEQARRKAQVDTVLNENEIELTEHDTLRHAFIGMDAVNGKLVYISYYEQNAPAEIIDLKDIRSAKVDVLEHHEYEERDGKSRVADRQTQVVQLVLPVKKENGEKYTLPFYQLIYDDIGDIPELKQKASRWEQVVNQWIKPQARVSK